MKKTILMVLISTMLSSPALCSLFGPPKRKTDDSARRRDAERTAGSAVDSGFGVIQSIQFENNRKYKDKTLLKKLDFVEGDYLDPVLAESGGNRPARS